MPSYQSNIIGIKIVDLIGIHDIVPWAEEWSLSDLSDTTLLN